MSYSAPQFPLDFVSPHLNPLFQLQLINLPLFFEHAVVLIQWYTSQCLMCYWAAGWEGRNAGEQAMVCVRGWDGMGDVRKSSVVGFVHRWFKFFLTCLCVQIRFMFILWKHAVWVLCFFVLSKEDWKPVAWIIYVFRLKSYDRIKCIALKRLMVPILSLKKKKAVLEYIKWCWAKEIGRVCLGVALLWETCAFVKA